MDYKDIENKYIEADIKGHYRFVTAKEVEKVLGYDFRMIKGFKELSDSDKLLAEILVCNFINGFGLQARETVKPTKIQRRLGKFMLSLEGKSFSYLYDDGSVG